MTLLWKLSWSLSLHISYIYIYIYIYIFVTKGLKIPPVLDKLMEYKRNWIQHVNRMPRNRLPRVMKHYSSTGRRNYGRHLKRLLGTWDRNGSTSGPTPWQIYDDEDDIYSFTGYSNIDGKIESRITLAIKWRIMHPSQDINLNLHNAWHN